MSGSVSKYIIPEELRFAVTRKCDGKCRHCYNQSGKNTDRLTADDFIHLLKEVHLKNPDFDRITLTGGEPLMEFEKVLRITKFAHSLGIKVRLVTRGWELNQEICRELKTAGVTKLQIGLDSSGVFDYLDDSGITWDTFHSWLRADKLGFHKTTGSIRIAVESGIDVSVRYSLCHSNFNDVINTYHFVSRLGVSKFKFRVLFPDGPAKKKLIHELITGEQMATAQYDLILASKFHDTVVEITQPCFYDIPGRKYLSEHGSEYRVFKELCPCGTNAAYIDSNGDVKYCLFDEEILGNVLVDSFLSVWNSDLMHNERRNRCPLDRSGSGCSSFKILYSQCGDYAAFMKAYVDSTKELFILPADFHKHFTMDINDGH